MDFPSWGRADPPTLRLGEKHQVFVSSMTRGDFVDRPRIVSGEEHWLVFNIANWTI